MRPLTSAGKEPWQDREWQILKLREEAAVLAANAAKAFVEWKRAEERVARFALKESSYLAEAEDLTRKAEAAEAAARRRHAGMLRDKVPPNAAAASLKERLEKVAVMRQRAQALQKRAEEARIKAEQARAEARDAEARRDQQLTASKRLEAQALGLETGARVP